MSDLNDLKQLHKSVGNGGFSEYTFKENAATGDFFELRISRLFQTASPSGNLHAKTMHDYRLPWGN
jgi:hypothetical protein